MLCVSFCRGRGVGEGRDWEGDGRVDKDNRNIFQCYSSTNFSRKI